MRKLIEGILDFRRTGLVNYVQNYAHLALGQKPDALFVACSDSRVVPNVFASSNPGDLFVQRNVGNLIPPCCDEHNVSVGDISEAACIEYALMSLNVKEIIICGHSECGAMKAVLQHFDETSGTLIEDADLPPHLFHWLEHALPSMQLLQAHISSDFNYGPQHLQQQQQQQPQKQQQRDEASGITNANANTITSSSTTDYAGIDEEEDPHTDVGPTLIFDDNLSLHNRLSQLNVIQQLQHICSYPIVAERLNEGTLQAYGWWFDIGSGNVYCYEPTQRRFVLIDEEEGQRLIERISQLSMKPHHLSNKRRLQQQRRSKSATHLPTVIGRAQDELDEEQRRQREQELQAEMQPQPQQQQPPKHRFGNVQTSLINKQQKFEAKKKLQQLQTTTPTPTPTPTTTPVSSRIRSLSGAAPVSPCYEYQMKQMEMEEQMRRELVDNDNSNNSSGEEYDSPVLSSSESPAAADANAPAPLAG